MRHSLHSTVRLILVALFLTSASPVRAEDRSPFTVAAIVPLTGRAADYGFAVRNGITLAQKNYPDLFSHVRFLFDDSLYDGKTSITLFQKMTGIDGADLVLVWGHGPVEAVTPVAESNAFPTIVVSGQRDVAAGKKYIIRFCSPHVVYAGALLGELRRRGHKKLAFVRTELGFITDTVAAIEHELDSRENIELNELFQPGETDFQSTITKLKGKKPDLLGLFLGEDQAPLFLSRMSAVRLNLPIFGTHTIGGGNVISAVQKYTDGAFFAGNFVDRTFHEQYKAAFGNDVQIPWAANAYDLAVLTAELFGKSATKPKREEIIAAYRRVKDRAGVSGRYSYNNDERFGDGFVFPVVIKTISKTAIQESSPADPLRSLQK